MLVEEREGLLEFDGESAGSGVQLNLCVVALAYRVAGSGLHAVRVMGGSAGVEE